MVLENMATACSCTAVTTEGKPINPQDSTKITVSLVGEKRDIGLVDKLITFRSNAKKRIDFLHLKGEIVVNEFRTL